MTVATMPESRSSASPQLTFVDLVERHRRRWLGDAAAYLRVLDWQGLAGRQLVLLDVEDVPGMPPQRAVGFTSPGGIFDLVRPFITTGGLEPGPVVFMDVDAVADHAVGTAIDSIAEVDAVQMVRVVANAIGIHEYAHAVDFKARGAMRPEGTTLATIFASTPTPTQASRSHGAGWVRAYAHLVCRSMAIPAHQEHYLDSFRSDVEYQGLGPAEDLLASLDDDVDEHGFDRPLVEILRSPAPAGFVELFQARDAARSANR